MEELIYVSIRLICLTYILYKVWGWRSKVNEICSLLYEKGPEKDIVKKPPVDSPTKIEEVSVVGSTRFVYLDENAGKTVAPYMSQPLESDFIGEDKDVPEEEVECKLPFIIGKSKRPLFQNDWDKKVRNISKQSIIKKEEFRHHDVPPLS